MERSRVQFAHAVARAGLLVISAIIALTAALDSMGQPASAGTLHIVNRSQYNMVSLSINGTEQFAPGHGITNDTSLDLTLPAGSYNVMAGVGFLRPNLLPDVWFHDMDRGVTISANQTTTWVFPAITIGQLMTTFRPVRDWVGEYYDGNGGYHQARFRFSINGTWILFDDNRQVQSGNLGLVAWTTNSMFVRFRLGATGEVVMIAHPFATFTLRDGPSSWPLIQYTAQRVLASGRPGAALHQAAPCDDGSQWSLRGCLRSVRYPFGHH